MKLTTLDEDLRIHQKLEDEPNDVGGLSAQALKEKFDQAGVTIQKYLNETHLPETEQAVEETLEQAKEYTDQQLAKLEMGDMEVAVYDTKRRGRDIFEYAEAKAREAAADTSNLIYSFAARSMERVRNAVVDSVTFGEPVKIDPKGLWSAEEQAFVMPQGAKGMILTACLRWARQSTGSCFLTVKINGEEQLYADGPELTNGSYVEETVIIPVPVQGNDRVSIGLEANAKTGYVSEIKLKWLRADVLM